jgi:hypothetical protein
LAQNNHKFLFVITFDHEGKQIAESIKSTDYASAIKELELKIDHKVDHKEVRIVNVQKPRG